jgi:hypothetical protein
MSVSRNIRKPLELRDAVDGDAADPSAARGKQLLVGLSCAVQRDASRFESGSLRGHELTQRTDVDADPVAG